MSLILFWFLEQIGLPPRGRLILLIIRMIRNQIGLHSVLLPLSNSLIIHEKTQ